MTTTDSTYTADLIITKNIPAVPSKKVGYDTEPGEPARTEVVVNMSLTLTDLDTLKDKLTAHLSLIEDN